jgi:glycosyltransferase involved in cell wall biosynthesis
LEPGSAADAPLRVCFLTHYFPPEVGAPQTRIDLLAHTLGARGAAVTVHTTFPHYPSGVITPPYRNRALMREQRYGIPIVRSAVYPAPNRGFVRRLANHASFALSALLTSPATGALDVVVAESPPLFTGASGALYAAIKRAAFVVHIADRWPASAVELGALRDARAIAAAEALERWIYRRADLIVAPTEGIVRALSDEAAARGKVRRVWPVVDLGRFDPRPPPDERGPLKVLFAGTVGLAHGLDVLVQAARIAGPGIVQVTIAGDGADAGRIRTLADEGPHDNVQMLGSVSSEEIPRLYARADAAVVLLRDLPIFQGALPTKVLEAMAAGRPLLLSAHGEAARLVDRAGAGIVVPPGDPQALAAGIRQLQSDPGRRQKLGGAARAYAEANFGAGRAGAEWETWLRDAIAAQRRAERSRTRAWR